MADDIQPAVQDRLRALPAVDHLLHTPAIAPLLDDLPTGEVTRAVRDVLDSMRSQILAGRTTAVEPAEIALAVRQTLFTRQQSNLRRVINATGIVLHTGLGRAPLAAEAVAAVAEVAAGYCNLELELESGERGDRHAHVRDLLTELTGAADALVVNNNAGATFLTLKALTEGRDVVISRGQLVEIGGSYRMPDVMAAAGCHMVEVGTTNRTHLADYRRVCHADTAALLRVHTSNYRIQGFTAEASIGDLASLARTLVPAPLVIDDLGSGLLDAPGAFPDTAADDGSALSNERVRTPSNWDEPTVTGSLRAGADIALFSGDKLLGGPQAGIIIGRADLVARIRSHPLMRALRPDKLTLAALEATLRLYRDPASLRQKLPTWRMLREPLAETERRARRLAGLLAGASADLNVTATEAESFAGGGTLPTLALPTWVVRLKHARLAAHELAAALRRARTPVVGRVQDDAFMLDCRTVATEELEDLVNALSEALQD